MTAKEWFHIVGPVLGLAAFASICRAARPHLVASGRRAQRMALIPIHCFRFLGLTALLPGVFNLAPAGFSDDYLNAGARVTPAIHDANILGAFGWIVMTVFLPAWVVSHLAIFATLRRPEPV